MRNVIREPIPNSLKEYASEWTNELLNKLATQENPKRKVASKYYNHYKQKDVKSALKKMYGNLCCYCECKIEPASFKNIEHKKPTDKFPGSTFDWDNLHFSCHKCNTYKLNKWDNNFPILDAVIDVPISEHLTYKEYYRNWITRRGKTTMKHPRLNRDDLLSDRKEIIIAAYRLIDEYKKNPDAPAVDVIKTKIREKVKEKYGSFFEHVMRMLAHELLEFD